MNQTSNRRDALAAIALASSGAALGGAGLLQPAKAATANIAKAGRIDVHNHMVPPAFEIGRAHV